MLINFHFLPGEDIIWVSSMSQKGIFDNIESCDISEFIDFDLLLNDNICNFSAVKFFADEEVIIAKRDFFGTIPLFFKVEEGSCYTFSDSLSGLLDVRDIQVNEERIHYYLNSDDLDKLQKTHLTFFEDIYQVPAGCIARISASCVEISSLNYLRTLAKKKGLVDIIKAKLSDVINQDSHVSYNVSGGIDSTGLASIHEHYLSTVIEAKFCALETGFESCNEKVYQKSFETKYDKEISFFEINSAIKQVTENYVNYSLHPPLLYSLVSVFDGILEGLKAQNVENLIMGHGGDSVLGHGYEYIAVLKRERNYVGLKKFIEKITEGGLLKSKFPDWDSFTRSKKRSISLLFFVFPHTKENLKYFPTFLGSYVKCGGSLIFFFFHVFKSLRSKFELNTKLFKINSIVKNNHLFKINYQPSRYPSVQNWVTSCTMEVFYNLSMLYNMRFVFPFFSTELLSISLLYSNEQKFGNGIGRAHFRRELAGILPQKVRNRIGKTSFDELFVSEIRNYINQVGDISSAHRLWKYVDADAYQRIVEIILDDEITYHRKVSLAHLIHRTLNIKIWLDCILKFENYENTK
ncbi:asparagine synthase-related protein [Lacihabitans soyangensis]|uniref:asparagine synthase (glutamine-hydrolyzing) n=1 Tax=Lacihabitans soyangensis TaxID=869394 RepID=A0AAE3KWH1_9BACT|nr:asparagine synthase-related protein [Lacihabitans soyangensis]MCP9765696.1 hypothetical protein [Lacihabitans soyangensis]